MVSTHKVTAYFPGRRDAVVTYYGSKGEVMR
jgi:hypothetical protein